MPAMTIQQAFELAVQHHRAGRGADADALYRQILTHDPHHAGALHMLGVLAHQMGRNTEALDYLRRAIALNPQPAFFCNLGMVLAAAGHLDEAAAVLRQALALRPNFPEASNNLGNVLKDQGELDEAITTFRAAVADGAASADLYNNLGIALHEKGLMDESVEAFNQAIRLQPAFAEAHKNLGNARKDRGELDAALACYRQAQGLRPDARTAGNLLFALHLHPDYGPARIRDEHRRWNDAYARPLDQKTAPVPVFRPHENAAPRRIRVGYVSPDLREHVVGRFLLPLLAHHDRTQFEIFCYSDVRRPDAMTARLREHSDLWRQTSALSHDQLAAQIRQDQIDLLIDLSMHTHGNRLEVFAQKPAPVQASYLAYCSTTGLQTMDYRLTDPYFDPPGEGDDAYSERSVRLPHTYWCYALPPAAGELGPPPALAAGQITFGCLNNYCKVSPPALALWCDLLRELPGSRLILHAPQGSHRQAAREQLARRGIDPAAIEFVGRVPVADYFDQYRRIDIALDPFPFAGGATTCDALWMGVPLVTFPGPTAVSRAGLSILSNIGLPELVAHSPQQYVRLAQQLAEDPARRTELRATLRERMLDSPLMNAPQYARDIEAAYRQMIRPGPA